MAKALYALYALRVVLSHGRRCNDRLGSGPGSAVAAFDVEEVEDSNPFLELVGSTHGKGCPHTT